MTLKGGTSQACAACKYQRRRCTADCPLAPYFPADQPKMFQNAHKLFGVSNILKILRELDPSQKLVAMKSIIYQSNIRDKYPVHGCLGIIQQLWYQIQLAEEELQAIHAQLALYRQHQQQEVSTGLTDSISQLHLGMAPPSNALSHFHQDAPQNYDNTVSALPIGSQPTYSSNSANAANYNATYMDSKENNAVNSLWVQQPPYNNSSSNINNSNPMVMQSQLINSQPLIIQQDCGTQDYDEMHPFFDTIDDRQSYIASKEAYESSSESSLKDTTQSVEHVAENELKSAVACFSLTSVN
ncbi:LOB domain-containing protein 27-like [Coffea arabica]|uniref:LOB domain-containing protein 27-like n=1 Tax=Coffea arabica TaxID=13443 RepID=A0A6P6XDC6_COFAR|nr:LOB domain-containing protein 27-like [Coffea arabica]